MNRVDKLVFIGEFGGIMNWLKNILKRIYGNVIIYGETKTGHTFSSYKKYLEYKEKQK